MRGQTTLDYAIGISIFLVTVLFALTFITGMLAPFSEGLEEETVASNRIADAVSQGMLGDPAEPYVANRSCVFAFFARDNTNGDGSFDGNYPMNDCNFETTDDLLKRLGVQGRPSGTGMNVQVRIERDLVTGEADSPDADGDDVNNGDPDDTEADVLCFDSGGDRIVESGYVPGGGSFNGECDATADVPFVAGDDPPDDTSSVVVARRTVYVEGGFADGTEEATLVVEVWE